jgi:hypothetical protein
MPHPEGPGARPTTAAVITALAVVGLVVSMVALWPALTGSSGGGGQPGTSAPGFESPGPSGTSTSGTDRPGGLAPSDASLPDAEGRSDVSVPDAEARASTAPTRVQLPTIDIDARVRSVGVAPDGQMQLPPDPRVMGWYRFGPAPGTGAGSVVLAGHLDSNRLGLGPLVRLRTVEVGDPVTVRMPGGTTRSYAVQDVTRYDRQGLPAELFSRSGPERLRLITCGGAYEPENGGYQQNLVVTAVPG